jgi:hypothetical protein
LGSKLQLHWSHWPWHKDKTCGLWVWKSNNNWKQLHILWMTFQVLKPWYLFHIHNLSQRFWMKSLQTSTTS